MKFSLKNGKLKKILDVLFIAVIVLALIAGIVRTVFFPKDINYYENRYCNKLIVPTISSFLDSSFQNSVEDSLADQIPKAQTLKKLYNDITSGVIDFFVEPIVMSNDKVYINYKGAKLFGGRYVYDCYDLDANKSAIDIKAENYNSVFEKYPDLDYYVYYIEKDTDVNFENGAKIDADEYLFSLLNLEKSHMRTYEINEFDEFALNFYKTDHHWNHIGSYKAYKDIVDFLGCTGDIIENGEEVLISEEFLGSKAAAVAASLIKDDFFAYKYDFPALNISINGNSVYDYGAQETFISGQADVSVTYGNFYGGDDGEIVFDSGKNELDNILVIGESYDNAVLKLLATHFNRTHSIDLRNYEHYFEKTFDFAQYVEDNDIDKVLFIGNIDFYIMDTFGLEIH